MISRRKFSWQLTAGALSACIPTISLAEPSREPPRSIAAIGVGGAGCNIIELLRREVSLGTHCAAHTFNSEPDLRPGASGCTTCLSTPLTAADADRIRNVVTDKDLVVLFAGLGGNAGSEFAPAVAGAAKRAGATVVGVVVMPFDFEQRRISKAQQARLELQAVADRVNVLENQAAFDRFLGMAFERYLERINRQAIQAFLGEMAHWGGV